VTGKESKDVISSECTEIRTGMDRTGWLLSDVVTADGCCCAVQHEGRL
jgi:hypothetical protein